MAEPTQREQLLAAEIDAGLLDIEASGLGQVEHTVSNRMHIARALAAYREELGAAPTVPALALLSPREREVVEWLLAGLRPTIIAARVSISHHTVRNHLKHIFRKLGVRSQIELLAFVRGGSAPHG
jgi:DNA-binding CsgD family transcriptional regulator